MINKALASQSTPVTTQLQVAGDYVNVRSGPGTNNRIIGQAHQGDILQAKAKSSDDWYQIDYQGGTGWVAGWCVQVYQPANPSTPTSPTTGTARPPNRHPTDRNHGIPAATGHDRPPSTEPNQPAGNRNDDPTSPATGHGTDKPDDRNHDHPATGTSANPGTLNVQVEQDNTGTTVDITGAQGTYQYQEETNPQCLLVTVPGITAVQNPSEIDVEAGGLDKIITSFPVATPGTTSGTTTGTTPVTTTGTNAAVTTPGTAQVADFICGGAGAPDLPCNAGRPRRAADHAAAADLPGSGHSHLGLRGGQHLGNGTAQPPAINVGRFFHAACF